MSSANPIPRLFFELLAEKLRVFLGHAVKDNKLFHAHMAGPRPIIDAARLSALERKVYHISARDRLTEVKDRCGDRVTRMQEMLKQKYGHLMVM